MSGSWGFTLSYTPPRSEASAMQELAITLGVPIENIILEDVSDDTIGNAYFTKTRILEPRHWTDITVVTSEFHMPRTRYIFQKVLGPNYDISFESADSGLASKDLEEEKNLEKEISKKIHSWFRNIISGSNKEIEKMIFTKDPGYTKYIQLSRQHVVYPEH